MLPDLCILTFRLCVMISVSRTSEPVKPTAQEKVMPEPSSNGCHGAAERPASTESSSSHSTALDEKTETNQGVVASTNRQPTDHVKKAKVIMNSYLTFRVSAIL